MENIISSSDIGVANAFVNSVGELVTIEVKMPFGRDGRELFSASDRFVYDSHGLAHGMGSVVSTIERISEIQTSI